MGKISVVINTYNEEKKIRNTLESVKGFDEIIICDMYSEDRTCDIAKEYGAKVVMHKKEEICEPARNFAISNTLYEWVLVVDADELITNELKNFLYEFIKNPGNYTAIKIPRFTYYFGEPIELRYPDYNIRFFKKGIGSYPPYIHSTVEIKEGEIYTIDRKRRELAIVHKQERSISQLLQTLDKYTSLEVEKLKKKNAKINLWIHFYKSLFLIFEKFFLKGGYKNGIKGFVVCTIEYGIYKFVVGCKYWEYLNGQNKKT